MKQVRLGSLTVSRLGFGCYAIGGAYGAKEAAQRPGGWEPLIHQAFDLGVTFFDTAEVYGNAEETLGRAVAPFREQVVIATKVGVSSTGQRDASSKRVIEACEKSLSRLGTERIDLYQIHFDDPATPVADTVGALEDLKAQGKIREYGVGHLPLDRVRGYARLGHPASVLFELSAVARSAAKDLLPFLRTSGVAGIAFSPTGRGLLTGAVTAGHRFESGDIRSLDPLFARDWRASGLRVKDRLAELGRRHGRSAAQVAIAWVLARPGVTAALTGPTDPAHLAENLEAADWPFPEDELKTLDAFLDQEGERLREASFVTCRDILAHPLAREGGAAYGDLIYVMETAVQFGLATEDEVMPAIVKLLSARKQTGEGYDPALEDLRLDVGRLLEPRLRLRHPYLAASFSRDIHS